MEYSSKIAVNQTKLLAEKGKKIDDYCNENDDEKHGNKNNNNLTNTTTLPWLNMSKKMNQQTSRRTRRLSANTYTTIERKLTCCMVMHKLKFAKTFEILKIAVLAVYFLTLSLQRIEIKILFDFPIKFHFINLNHLTIKPECNLYNQDNQIRVLLFNFLKGTFCIIMRTWRILIWQILTSLNLFQRRFCVGLFCFVKYKAYRILLPN